jgi:glycosyltransferase involved in cell wall biosynthesis
MNIAVIGYPYTRPNFRTVFESSNTYFILPRIWKIKGGKAEYYTESSSHVVTTTAPFYHSNYPMIGGLLKGWMPMLPWLLWKLKRKHQIDLVFEAHEPTLLTTLYHGLAAKILGLKHVVFSWENIPFDKKFVGVKGFTHRLILSANLIFADGVVCGNQKCLDIFKKITPKPLAHIPLAGLNPDKFRPYLIRPEHEGITFVFAGAIDYRKGLHVLLPAFKQLLEKIPEARLVLVGSGTYEKEIKVQIDNLKLAVTQWPWVDHAKLIEILSRSDVFVYPSIPYAGWEEQFGYSIAEASLMELPVIATRSGSIEEVVKDKDTGLLVDPGEVGPLADAMLTLASDKSRRSAYGRAGREFITQKFSNEAVARRYETFFNLLI